MIPPHFCVPYKHNQCSLNSVAVFIGRETNNQSTLTLSTLWTGLSQALKTMCECSTRCWILLTAGTVFYETANALSSLSSPNALIPNLLLLVRLQCTWKMQLHYHWFMSVWNKAVQILGTCISVSFSVPLYPFSLLLSLHSHPHFSLALSSTSWKSIPSVPHGRDDGSLAAYHAFHQTTKGSKHVHGGSCAPLLNSILCGISGDWHVLCPSERVSSAQKCDSWAELFHSSHMRKTDRNET